MNNQNLIGVYYNPQAAKFVLFIQPGCKLSRNEKQFIKAITFDGLELVNSLPGDFIQLCYLVLYQKSMVASPGYDNKRIRHAYDGDSTVCFR